jgi:hypothetical protein
VLAFVVAACGQGGSSNSLSISQLPLVDGARVVTQVRQCDSGANAFCAIQAVIVAPRFGSSGALVASEHRYLRKLGWSSMAGDNGNQRASESPGHKVRLTYGTGFGDLIGWDEKWITRPWPIVWTLDGEFIKGTPTMSVMLEAGGT